jgi:hypothetical protein
MITFLVGDITDYLAAESKKIDRTAKLVTEKNYKNILSGTHYISIGDFSSRESFVDALCAADKLIYCPPTAWSDPTIEKWTRICLFAVGGATVENLTPVNLDGMLNLSDTRKTDQRQIWNAGCSITYGSGLLDKNQRYGQLISDQLNLPVSFLSAPGSSVIWAADQILRSDLRTGDIVVWGLTGHRRFPYYDTKLNHIHISTYSATPEFNKVVSIDHLDSTNLIYHSICSIAKVINFCNKLDVKLLVGGLIVDEVFNEYAVSLIPNYVFLNSALDKFKDIGTDGVHPGPETHKWYAEELLDLAKSK